MNRAESERLGSLFEQLGYQPTAVCEQADLIVLNSCVVRQSAESRVTNKLADLRRLKKLRPALKLAVTGCLVDSQGLEPKYPFVDHFFKPGDWPQWLTEEQPALPQRPSPSTFVPIIQGCDNFCSYCIVPYRRGREKSRPLAEIECEVKQLAGRGAKEVVLLGQNVDSYGGDLPGKPDLADLLHRLNAVEGIARLRFLTNHPKDMNRKLIEAMASLEKVCPQLNLPVQSGDDGILEAMKRGYTVEQYRRLVGRIRASMPDVSLSTDIIVGFPGESREQFQGTVNLLGELRFDSLHTAAYSPRPGTFAAREYEDNIATAEKKRRLQTVEQLQQEIATEINARLLGKPVEVLIEGRKKGKWYGRSRGGKLVFTSHSGDLMGQIIKVRVKKTSPWSLQGEIE